MQTHSLDYSRDTLLSQDVAVSLLQENKMALKRCELVRRIYYSYYINANLGIIGL